MASRRLPGLVVLAAGLALVGLGAGTGSVEAADPPVPAPLIVYKIITGPLGVTLPTYTADFEITADCGPAGTHTETATATTIPVIPGPAVAAEFTGLPLGASCIISEGPLPAPPDGFAWVDPVYSSGKQATIQPITTQLYIENPLVPEGMWVRKDVATDPAGPFENAAFTYTGRTVTFRITVENVGDVPLTGVTLTDDTMDLAAEGCQAPTELDAGERFVCTYSVEAVTGQVQNTATADSAETEPVTDWAVVVANPAPPDRLLTIGKSTNGRKAFLDVPGGPDVVVSSADEGDTITYTLKYQVNTEEIGPMTIADVIPAGLTYVPFSATGSDQIFPARGPIGPYDPVTRTLRWTTARDGGGAIVLPVTKDGSVSYRVTVDQGAAGLQQPLRNVVTAGGYQVLDASADHLLYVGPLPDGVHFAPDPTAPATDAVEAGAGGGSGPRLGFWLIVFALAGLVGGSVLVGRVPGARGVRPR